MSFQLEKVNTVVIKKVRRTRPVDPRPIKGYDLFHKLYCNICMIAPPRSGKTTVIENSIFDCAGKDTVVCAFCGTLDADDTWYEIKEKCERKGIPFIGHTGIVDDDGINQVEVLTEFLMKKAKDRREAEKKEKERKERLANETAEDKRKRKESKTVRGNSFFEDPIEEEEEEEVKKPKKSKTQTPEFIIIFDDLPGLLKNTSLVALMKKFRHFRAKIIISCHYICDLLPDSVTMLDYCLVFKGITDAKLDDLRKMVASSIDQSEFQALYKDATRKDHSFLYIDCRENLFRKNFNEQYVR